MLAERESLVAISQMASRNDWHEEKQRREEVKHVGWTGRSKGGASERASHN